MASSVLKAFASQYFPQKYLDQILAEIDSTGKISDETLKSAGISKKSTLTYIKNQVADLAPRQSLDQLSQSQLKDIVGTRDPEQAVNEGNLTDEGLQSRQDIFNRLGNSKGSLDPSSLEGFFKDKLKAHNVHDASVDRVAKQLSDQVSQLGRMPTAGELKSAYPGLVSPELQNFFDDQDVTNQLSGLVKGQLDAPDTSSDVSRISDLLSTRKQDATNEKSLQDYLTSLPDILSQSSNDSLAALQEQGASQLEDATPGILANANARGALFSGDVPDALSNAAGGVQGGIESAQAQMEAENNQFYFNAAYQDSLRKQLAGQGDYGNFLSGERSRVLNEQSTRFQNSQNLLQQNANNDLAQRQYNQQLTAQKAQLQKQADYAKSQKQAALYQGIGSTVGAVAGAAVGGPVGAVVGSQAGGSVGQIAGS